MKKTNKKMIAILLVLILVASFIPFKVFAGDSYTITFVAEQGHVIEIDGGHLKIDNQYVDPRLASAQNDNTFNGYTIEQNNTTGNYEMKITNGEAVVLNFNSGNAFDLYVGTSKINAGTEINGATVVTVKNFTNENPIQQPDQSVNTTPGLNINFEGNAGGKVWYKFDTETTETEVVGNRTNITIPQGATGITLRGEDRTIGRLEFNINGISSEVSKEAFRTEEVMFTITEDDILQLYVEYMNDGQVDDSSNTDFSDIAVDVRFNNTEGEVLFNGIGNGRTPEGPSFNGILEKAGYTDADKTNKIEINTSTGMAPIKKVTINGTDYEFNSQGYEVPGAETYTIVVEGDTEAPVKRTIIWTNPDYEPKDEEDANWVKDFSISHAYAKIIEVYDKDNNLLKPDEYINTIEQPDGTRSDEYGLNNGFGWVSIFPGSKVIFEFVPEYGYQLTGIKINEQPIEAAEAMNKFEFTMPDESGNIHFAAEFTKTEDVVKASSEKVSAGSIELGNVLPGGSAQLTVKDVELSYDKIKGFEGAAEGYTVANYLDIDLYNVFYKGKVDDEDVWSNKIDELDEYATISIQLEEGVNAEDIVLVHNIHDGDEYEIIEIDSYDPETRTITFKTKSFSNYAIATKDSTTTSDTIENVKTGDNIAIFFIIFTVAIIGTIAIVVLNKRSLKVSKH